MKEFWAENKKHLLGIGIAALLLSLLPLFEMLVNIGPKWHGAPPSYIDDNYYYVRMKEIVDGHPLLGNPYLKEHADDIAPAFVFPDWVYALPLLAGVPLVLAVSINFSVWSVVFVFLLYIFLRKMALSKTWSAMGTLFCYTQVYLLVLRPVSMQLVYPVFLLFLIAWFRWQDHPKKRSAIGLLAFATALTFYDYGYLWQIAVVFLGLMFSYLLWEKDRLTFRYFLVVNGLTFVLLIPFVLFTLKQLHHPDYWETMVRTGLVMTHLPTAVAFYTGGWVCALVLMLFLSLRFVPELRMHTGYVHFVLPFSLIGVAMSIVSLSNIITGKELETANHVERFIKLWLAMGIVVPLYYFFEARAALTALSARRKIILGLLMLVVTMGNIWYSGDLNVFFHPKERLEAVLDSQEYIPVYAWLDAQTKAPQVIWVDPRSDLAGTIPIYTKQYVLYSSVAALHLVSNNEIEERYLTASYLHEPQPTVKSITMDARNFEGVARGFHLANTHNRGVKICRIFQLSRLGYDCGVVTDSETLNTPLGETMFKRYTEEIKPHIKYEVEKFHVMYIMKDKKEDVDFHPELIVSTPPVYEDQRFVIYKLN